MAKEKGLEPLAELVWAQDTTQGNPNEYAAKFVDEEMEVTDTDEAMEGALHIIAEWINESAEVREKLRDIFREHAVVKTEKNPAVNERTNFEDYYEFSQKAKFRSEEHTSELQSRFDLVCRLLLEKNTDKDPTHISP